MPTAISYHRQPLQRTQISLSLTLRRQINQVKKPQESLAEFIRQAIELKIQQQQQERSSRQTRLQAAKQFIGCSENIDHPYWKTDVDINNWQRQLRVEPSNRYRHK